MSNKRLMVVFGLMMLCGCAQDGEKSVPLGPSPEADGWKLIGTCSVGTDSGRDALPAGRVSGPVTMIRFDADGPAKVDRIVVTFVDGTTHLPEGGLDLGTRPTQVIALPKASQLDRVALVHSGAGAWRKTVLTVWAK